MVSGVVVDPPPEKYAIEKCQPASWHFQYLEFVDKAHVDVPGVLCAYAAHTRAACGGLAAPNVF